MRILYIAHFLEGGGWSHAAISNVKALKSVGADVVCRNIKLSAGHHEVPSEVSDGFQREVEDIDVCVQHVLPHHVAGSDLFKKNVACCVTESNTLKHLNWLQSLKQVDEVWVPCETNKTNLEKDGIEKVRTIPYPFDVSSYKKVKGSMNVGIDDNFKFYTIVDTSDRKNLESIIRCFHSEFRTYEPVELIIKTHSKTVPSNVVQQQVGQLIQSIKESLRMYPKVQDYKNEIVVSDYMDAETIRKLHGSCDCFVLPSRGEGFSIPAFEAMMYGNTPICSNDGGPKDFIDPNNKSEGWLVSGTKDICVTRTAAFNDLHTGFEEWFHPSESEIKQAMRYYFENRNEPKKIATKEEYSMESVGKLILVTLNDVQ